MDSTSGSNWLKKHIEKSHIEEDNDSVRQQGQNIDEWNELCIYFQAKDGETKKECGKIVQKTISHNSFMVPTSATRISREVDASEDADRGINEWEKLCSYFVVTSGPTLQVNHVNTQAELDWNDTTRPDSLLTQLSVKHEDPHVPYESPSMEFMRTAWRIPSVNFEKRAHGRPYTLLVGA
jgi:hypothetical protein